MQVVLQRLKGRGRSILRLVGFIAVGFAHAQLSSLTGSPSAFRLAGQRSYAIFVWKEGEPGNEATARALTCRGCVNYACVGTIL